MVLVKNSFQAIKYKYIIIRASSLQTFSIVAGRRKKHVCYPTLRRPVVDPSKRRWVDRLSLGDFAISNLIILFNIKCLI